MHNMGHGGPPKSRQTLQVEVATPSWALLGIQHVAPYKDMLVGSTVL